MGQIIDGRRNGISASQPAKPAERVPPPRPFEGDLGAWHEGERAAQARVGMAARMLEVGQRALRSFMTEQHRAFFAGLPFLVIGSVDAQGRPWASILFNRPGFATSTDPVTLNVAALPDPSDPLSSVLAEGTALGLLGIELPTLRRNRLNGHVRRVKAPRFSLCVDQSFANCPHHLHRRDYPGL